MKLDNYPFNGWDFTELAEAWGVYIPEDYWIPGVQGYHPKHTDYDPIVFLIKGALSHARNYDSSRVIHKMAGDLRIYLTKLSTGYTMSTPLWGGMAKIEHDYTLLDYATILMGSMWD